MLSVFVTDVFNRLFGTLECEVVGVQTERFLTLAMRENLDLWACRRPDGCTLCFRTRMLNLRNVEELAGQAGCEFRLKKKRGLPPFLKKYRTRYGILAGVILFFAFLLVMTSFVWEIDVVGACSDAEKQQILAVLHDNGFYIGASLARQDYTDLKNACLERLDSIGYLTVNVNGTRATVEVSPKKEKPSLRFAPCNIVAAADGVVRSVRVYNGVTEVRKGDLVRKGQLLAGGVYNSKVLGFRTVHASACVMAETIETLETFVPCASAARVHTGQSSSYSYLELFGWRINLTFRPSSPFEEYTVSVNEKRPELFPGRDLPVRYGRVEFRETQREPGKSEQEEVLEEARRRLAELEHVAMAGKEIVSRQMHVVPQPDGIRAQYVYTVLRDIAEEQIIETKE